jgi:hypothetical protein
MSDAVVRPILALEAAVGAVARVDPPVTLVATAAAFTESGFARVLIREGRAFAFSLSLSAVARVVRPAARRGCRRHVSEFKLFLVA